MTVSHHRSAVFRLAIAQSAVTLDVHKNGATIRAFMAQARDLGAKLIQFPEGALSGYPGDPASKSALADWCVDWEAIAEEIELVAREAGELGVWVVFGTNSYNGPNRRPNNSLVVVDDSGNVRARYDKRLLSFTEVTDWYTAAVTFDVDGYRFGCALCIELQYSELFLAYEQLGVDIMLVSSYSDDPAFALLAQGHAALNSYWVSLVVPAQYSHSVPSGLADPNGDWAGRCPSDAGSELVVVDIDRSDPSVDIAVNKRRPWRRVARQGGIYVPEALGTTGLR
jgi:predicted amidohydrolase